MDLLHAVSDTESLAPLTSGMFVEFSANVQKNPLSDTFAGFRELMAMAVAFDDKPVPNKKAGSATQSSKGILKQIESVEAALSSSGSIDLVAHVTNSDVRCVLVSDMNYFNDSSLNEMIDGDFTIVGKVTRVVSTTSGESINLLRKTVFGRLSDQFVDQMMQGLSSVGSAGIKTPEMQTEIHGPALQVVPIAVFA